MMLLITTAIVVVGLLIAGVYILQRTNSRSGGNDNVWKRNDEDTRNPDGSSTGGEAV